jgi:hypothetical protein
VVVVALEYMAKEPVVPVALAKAAEALADQVEQTE